jgi:hypothetical protein
VKVTFEFDPDAEREKELTKHIDRFRKIIFHWGPDFINPTGMYTIEAFLRDIDPRRPSLEVEEDT